MNPVTIFGSIFKESGGKLSLLRLSKMSALAITFMVWSIICIEKQELVDIPPNVAYINIALILGKVLQKFGEDQ